MRFTMPADVTQLRLLTLTGGLLCSEQASQHLLELGIDTQTYASVDALIQACGQHGPAVCALDAIAAGGSTVTLAGRLAGKPDLAVVVLGTPGNTGDQIRSLLLGADAWLSVDTPFTVIAATIYAIFRRLTTSTECADPAPSAPWRMAEDGWRLQAPNGHGVALTRRERDIVSVLGRQSGRTVTRAALVEHLSASGAPVSPEAVNMLVSRVRAKARRTGMTLPLASLPGRGYRLDALMIDTASGERSAQGPCIAHREG
ncbi:response regulator transcription factor [Verticiella sediminum]|uniref:response regulator transcription factor n=1 Tax=Verticiella sediminum TaxID=1247510 RepID=UPI00147850B7|nr:winged helix-turn-helix domain-containing protein [Verticiella sediminum]